MKASRFLSPLLCLFFVADLAPSGCRGGGSRPQPPPKSSAVTSPAVVLPS